MIADDYAVDGRRVADWRGIPHRLGGAGVLKRAMVANVALALAAGMVVADPRKGDPDGHDAPVAASATAASEHRDRGDAIEQYKRDAQAGDAEAQWRLCQAYARGIGVDADQATAKAWCQPAAEAGHIWAQDTLGRLYARSSPPDYPRALKWYKLASDQGSALARISMYFIYADGRPRVPRDLVKALAYLDYAEFGRMADGRRIVFTAAIGNPAGSAGCWMRDMLTAKMSKKRIAEAQELLHQWTGGEAPPDESVIECLRPD